MKRTLALACAMLLLAWFAPSAGAGRSGEGNDVVSWIVQTAGDSAPAAQAAEALGARVTHRWQIIDGFAAQMPAGAARRLSTRPDVRSVSLNSALLATGRPGGGSGGGTGAVDASKLVSAYPHAARAVDAWNAGLTGNGVGVAIVDSGIDGAGLDLSGRVVANVTFSSMAQYQADRYGHGTHVAGIVAGNGQAGGGKYIGIAPKANLFNVKFSADDGSGRSADLLSALDWVYQNQNRGIRVVNLSVTSATPESYKTSPLSAAVERLWFNGIVVVVAAGNRGAAADAVQYPPANDPYVITVGALDDAGTASLNDDAQASWSSRGLTQDSHAKPDLLAPGAHIVSLKACNSCTLMAAAPGNVVDSSYFVMGGTSMAAPMVSGAVALMLEQNPGLTPDQVKAILVSTARSWTGMGQGAPKALDAHAAATFAGTPGAANTGLTPSTGSGSTGSTGSNVHWLVSLTY